MIAALSVLALVVGVLAVLVAGLLRSHAVILRRLHELGTGVDESAPGTAESGVAGGDVIASGPPPGAEAVDSAHALTPGPATAALSGVDAGLPRPPAVVKGRTAHDITGAGPRGEAHGIRVVGTSHDTILVFLSSGCTTCHAFWDDLRDVAASADPRIVVVTRGDDAESPAAVADVAPSQLTVVMSSDAWHAYEVPGSPYVVHVDGPSGRVRGEGTGPTWHQVQRMLRTGAADLDARREQHRKANADARREQDVDRMLQAAGIHPGDPSLYARADGSFAATSDLSTSSPDTGADHPDGASAARTARPAPRGESRSS